MQSIETYYIPASNTRGSRIKAKSSGDLSITVEWDDALHRDENHKRAARMLIEKYKWGHHTWWFGDTKRGCVFVCCGWPEDTLVFSLEQATWVEAIRRPND